jgi:hypothetical protein
VDPDPGSSSFLPVDPGSGSGIRDEEKQIRIRDEHHNHNNESLVRGKNVWVIFRVVDPYSFFPDPEFDVGDQYGSGSGSGSNTDPGL